MTCRCRDRRPGHRRNAADLAPSGYDCEYRTDALELQARALPAHAGVLLIDDVLATGGTLTAASSLVSDLGATVTGIAVVLEIAGLDGRHRLAPASVFSAAVVG